MRKEEKICRSGAHYEFHPWPFPLNFHLPALGKLGVRAVPVLLLSITGQICLSGTVNFFYKSTPVDWADPCDLAANHGDVNFKVDSECV